MSQPSRGTAISAYIPAFASAKVYGENIQSGVITSAHIKDGTVVAADVANGSITSAKLGTSAVTNTKVLVNAIRNAHITAKAITSAKIRAAFLSGTISGLSNGHVIVAHGLAVKPKFVTVTMIRTLGETTAKHSLGLSTISAATSANIYIMSSKAGNVKYVAYVQL